MKCIKTEDAVGHVLCQDMTQIIPGVSKGPRFRKGHIVTAEAVSYTHLDVYKRQR